MKHPKYLSEVDSCQTTAGTRGFLFSFAAVLCLSAAWQASAASGTWTNLSSSIWGDATNWLNAVVADGNGATADFSTINATADVTVSLDTTRTNTSLIFGDTDPGGSPMSWTLDNGGNAGNLLEMAGSSPTITVNQLGANNERTLTISATIDGVSGLVKAGGGILNLTAANTWTNGTIISNGIIVMSATAATLGVNLGTNPVTFYGSSGAISNNWGAGNQPTISNSIVIPAGQTGTIYMGNRIRFGGQAVPGNISGGGTLNLVVGTTVTRDDIFYPAGNFTGTVNFVGSGGVRFFVNGGNFSGFSNGTVNVNGPIDWNFNDNSAGNAFAFGALQGTNVAARVGFTSAGGAPRLVVGQLNTDASFAGQFVNTAQIIKNGSGTWTFLTPTNHTHTGSNVVGAGKWILPTGASFSNAVSMNVSNGATLSIQSTPGFGRFVSCPLTNQAGSTLEFNFAGSAPSTTVAPLLVNGNFSPSTTTTMNIKGGIWSTGVFPLLKYTNVLGGNGFPALALGTQPARTQGYLSNDTATTSIDYVVTSTAEPLRWVVGNGTWDTSATFEWNDANGVFVAYQESGGIGDSVVFGDNSIIPSAITVTLNSVLSPIGIAANATNKNYTISGSGGIAGLGSITKSGPSTLILSTPNSFSGGVNLNGGIVNFSALNNLGASSSPLTFGGGTLQWASGNTSDISVRSVRFNTDGILDTAGNNVTFASGVGNGSAGGLTKTGAGTLTLSGANNYSGVTTVNQGTLTLASGATIANSPSIVVNSGAIFDAGSAGITLSAGSSQSLSGNGTVSGAVSCPANTSLKPGTSPGTLTLSSDLVLNGGTVVFDVSTNAGGTDRLVVNGTTTFTGGTVQLVPATVLTNGTYKLMQVTSTVGSPGTLLLTGFAQSGQIAFLSDATPGEIDLIVATGGTNNLFWNGTLSSWDLGSSLSWSNAATTLSSVFNQGDTVTFDDSGAGNTSVSLAGLIYPSSATPQRVTVAGSTSYTMQDGSGNGSGRLIGPASISKSGSGTLTLLTVNNNTGPTVINGGTVQVGNSGTTGNLGFGNVTNNGLLVFSQPDDRSVSGSIAGSGALVQQGAAVLTLTKDSSYTGPTTVTSGTLQVGAGGTTGTLGSGPITNAGTLIINRAGSLTVASGIAGSGAPNPANLIKIGTGTLTLGGVNTYEGNTYVSNGIVKLGASEVIPDGGATTGWLILDGGATAGTLDLNGFNETVNSLSGLGGTVLGRIMNNTGSATNALTVNGTASTTFAGIIQDNSGAGGKVALVLNGAGPLNLTGASTYSGGTLVKAGTLGLGTGGQAGTASISLSNGTTLNLTANGVSVFPGNDIITQPDGTVSFLSANLANGIAGNFISGNSNSTNLIAGPISISGNFMQFSNFAGTVLIQDGFQLRFSSTSLAVNGGSNTTFIVGSAATLNTRNGTGVAAGSGIYLGALLGSGGTLGGSANNGTSVFVVGGKGSDCTYSGSIVGAAPTSTFITKVGSGTLTLDGTISHEGSTVVSNGVLKIASINNSSAALDTSTNIVVRAGAFLDVSDRSDATLNLNNAQTLSGSGTIRGSLNTLGTSVVSPGDTVGILTVTNTATLGAAVNMELNRTNAPNSDRLVAPSIVLNPNATLTVTNIGPGLRPGDTFQLFGGPITGTFTTVTLPALAPCLSWDTSQLYTLGRISVTGSVCPPAIGSLALSGNTLQLSWPSSYIGTGWQLQAQTNAINAGLGTNWATVAGSGATNQVFMPVAVTNGCVFYRMIY